MTEFKFPFQGGSRSFSVEGLGPYRDQLLSEVVMMHSFHRGITSPLICFGPEAHTSILDSLENEIASFGTCGVCDAELIDFVALSMPDQLKLNIKRRHHEPLAGNPYPDPQSEWVTVRTAIPIRHKSHVLWSGASQTGWFRTLAARAAHEWGAVP